MDTAEEGKCIVTLLSTLLGLTSVSLVGASETVNPGLLVVNLAE